MLEDGSPQRFIDIGIHMAKSNQSQIFSASSRSLLSQDAALDN